MDIPERVTILGLDYTVERRDMSDDDECGFIVPRRQLIVIDEKVSDQLAAQTFIHEVMHGILSQLGYDELYEDEKLVQGLALGVYQSLFAG